MMNGPMRGDCIAWDALLLLHNLSSKYFIFKCLLRAWKVLQCHIALNLWKCILRIDLILLSYFRSARLILLDHYPSAMQKIIRKCSNYDFGRN